MSSLPQASAAGVQSGARRLDAGTLIQALALHRQQQRPDSEYWNEYCRLLRMLCRAGAVLVVRPVEGGGYAPAGVDCPDGWLSGAWAEQLPGLEARARQNGFAYCPVVDTARQQRILAVVRTTGAGDALVLLDIPERERAQLNELVMRALLAADFAQPAPEPTPQPAPQPALAAVPLPSAANPAQPQPASQDLLALLDLAAQVMGQQRFGAACMMLVNGIAAHFQASQVALGWIDRGKVKVAAASHLDRIEHNSETARLLEQAFLAGLGAAGPSWHRPDEAQDAAGPQDVSELALAHARLQAGGGYPLQCLLPVPDGAGAVRAMLFVGFSRPDAVSGAPGAIDALQAALGFVQPWLQTLRERDRGFGWRLASALRRGGERYFGPGFGWGRAGVAAIVVLLLFALFGEMDYHVEASSQLTTDSSRIISAQYDSRIETVDHTAGDLVRAGTLLATLDTRELRQQELDIRAERQRLGAEADKARAAGNLAEMEIAQARLAQADARLARVLHYLLQSRAVAPFDGVVVEGERKELLNAPVKKGDKLFKVARIDGLYVEMMVPEREIRYVTPDATGVLRLVARPDLEIPLKLATIIPVAQVKGQEGNHFMIKAELMQSPESWWRPGMSGMVRIAAGRHNVLWIWTHRVVDTLRMKLWWLGW